VSDAIPPSRSMNVFVTGGNGFIGSVVVRQLVALGHHVTCLLRPTSNLDRLSGVVFDRALGDVKDVASVQSAMAGCECTVHLAAPGGWANDDPTTLRRVIVGGTRNVLRAAGALVNHRVVVVSSTAAINASDVPHVFDERALFTVNDSALEYAVAKHWAEFHARAACERGVPVIVVNPSEVYGPGDTARVTAGNLIDFATSTPVLVCHGGTSVVHVDDVASGIVAALHRGRPGERYILAGENLTIRQIAELCLELLGRHAVVVTVPNGVARFASRLAVRLRVPLPFNPHVVPYATRYWFMNNVKARTELRVTFRDARETLRSTLEWLRESGALRTGTDE
jgi:dihydroflavonol-4-reductase